MAAGPRARFAPRSRHADVRPKTAQLGEKMAFEGWKALLEEAYRLDGFVGIVHASAVALQMVDEFAAAAQAQGLPINLARATVSSAWFLQWAMPLTAQLEGVTEPGRVFDIIERLAEEQQG